MDIRVISRAHSTTAQIVTPSPSRKSDVDCLICCVTVDPPLVIFASYSGEPANMYRTPIVVLPNKSPAPTPNENDVAEAED